ncbi:alpha/beta hydrolase [Histoplasma capsulatum G186AR]|uniref:Alpha/beta hydrolase n=1 Tax=Ajellomyces capsulatus (strain G186AR / H82 / ATCC MYA-2454 / RMSCC 2432) TaxID=447093 RepID=C0NMD5_AJECG|nr:alpha/beta hydrolase [Histoplasma capsulatum G186AR]EEH07786.1 alpha/beta hydrolase [Histoplasma capsulatum G186AR]
MPRFTSPFDGAQLFYRDYQPTSNPRPFNLDKAYASKQKPALVFIHGWPMSSLMFEQQTLALCETYRFRCIAPDRRGFGQSDWNGGNCAEPGKEQIDYNVFAQDAAHLLEKLDIGPFVFVAASMGPGETLLAYERSEYVRTLPPSLSVPSPEHKLSEFTLRRLEGFVAQADSVAIERCIQIITGVDFTDRLRKLGAETDIPIMCVHGDQDLGCPIEATSQIIKEIIPRTVVRKYESGAHGLYITHGEQLVQDILAFIEGSAS